MAKKSKQKNNICGFMFNCRTSSNVERKSRTCSLLAHEKKDVLIRKTKPSIPSTTNQSTTSEQDATITWY